MSLTFNKCFLESNFWRKLIQLWELNKNKIIQFRAWASWTHHNLFINLKLKLFLTIILIIRKRCITIINCQVTALTAVRQNGTWRISCPINLVSLKSTLFRSKGVLLTRVFFIYLFFSLTDLCWMKSDCASHHQSVSPSGIPLSSLNPALGRAASYQVHNHSTQHKLFEIVPSKRYFLPFPVLQVTDQTFRFSWVCNLWSLVL